MLTDQPEGGSSLCKLNDHSMLISSSIEKKCQAVVSVSCISDSEGLPSSHWTSAIAFMNSS